MTIGRLALLDKKSSSPSCSFLFLHPSLEVEVDSIHLFFISILLCLTIIEDVVVVEVIVGVIVVVGEEIVEGAAVGAGVTLTCPSVLLQAVETVEGVTTEDEEEIGVVVISVVDVEVVITEDEEGIEVGETSVVVVVVVVVVTKALASSSEYLENTSM